MTNPVSGATAANLAAGPAQPAATPRPATSSEVAEPAPAAAAPVDLKAVAEALSKAFHPTQTDLRFQVDKLTGQMVISVIDAQDGKTLLQIPDQEALAVAQSLAESQAHLIQRQA
jgi:uncharacterized FlaG/YvyC family protein